MGITPKQIAEMDQAGAILADTFPRLWYGLYSKLKEEGFTSEESLELVKAFIQQKQ